MGPIRRLGENSESISSGWIAGTDEAMASAGAWVMKPEAQFSIPVGQCNILKAA